MYFLFLVLFHLANSAAAENVEDDFSDIVETAKNDDFGSLSIGHNLSTNNRTLSKNQWTIGTLYVARGLTDNWSLGTSVFVWLDFKMLNLMTRYAAPISGKQKLGFDFAYFKTYSQGEPLAGNRYTEFMMEAISTKLTYSHQFFDNYRFNTTLSYFYYFDDRMPFSFRMDPANSDPFTINLTSLNEFKINENVYINLEGGFWGLNYEYLYYHSGISIGVQNDQALFAVGVSTTFSPTFPKEQAREFAGYDSRRSVHPEVQIQLFF